MSDPSTRSAVIVDPHPLWLDALEGLFEEIGVRIAGKTTSLEVALEHVRVEAPDLVVVEVARPSGPIDPFEFVAEASRYARDGRVVVCSISNDPHDVQRALAAGAVAYVVKTTAPDDLAVAMRRSFDSLEEGAAPVPLAPVVPAPPELTPRETEILRLVAEGHTNPELARILWVTEQTVKFHLTNVYRKLRVGSRAEATRWAINGGLVAGDDSADAQADEPGSSAV